MRKLRRSRAGREPLKIQSKVPGREGEAVIVEDEEHVWAVELNSNPLVRAAVNRIGRDLDAEDWETINPSLRRARKSRR